MAAAVGTTQTRKNSRKPRDTMLQGNTRATQDDKKQKQGGASNEWATQGGADKASTHIVFFK
jgi:hypothetical protein